MTRSDPYADWDAAYVLGALSAADRSDFEEHLAECPSCRDAVSELAGLPGLLAKVPAADVAGLEPPDDGWPDPPASLMPPLPPARELPAPRRRRWLVPAAAAVALLVGGIGGYAVARGTSSPAPSRGVVATGPVRLAFTDVVPSLMTAVVDVSSTTAGTRLRVECQYSDREGDETYPEPPATGRPTTGPTAGPGATAGPTAGPTGVPGATDQGEGIAYALWIVTRDGRSTELVTWTAVPGVRRDPTVTTGVPPSDLTAIEIRLVDGGQTLLRADVTGTVRSTSANASARQGGVTANA